MQLDSLLQQIRDRTWGKDFATARELLRRVADTSPDEPRLLILEAELEEREYRYNEAIERLAEFPESGEKLSAALVLGRLYRKVGDVPKAAGIHGRLAHDSDEARVSLALAEDLMGVNRADEAYSWLEPLLEKYPDSLTASLANAKWHNLVGLYQQSMDLAQPLLEHGLVGPEAWLVRIDDLFQLERTSDWLAAVDEYGDREGADPRAKLWRAKFHEVFEDYEAAQALADEVSSQYPDMTEAVLQQAVVAWKQDEIDVARQHFDRAFERAPWHDVAVGMRTIFCASEFPQLVDWDEVMRMAEQSNYRKLPYYIGKTLLGVQGDPDSSMHWLELSRERLPEHVDSKILLAQAHLGHEDFSAAKAMFAEALVVNEAHATAWEGLGYVFYQLDEPEEARNAYQTALSLAPDKVNAQHTLGLIFMDLNDLTHARTHLEEALALTPCARHHASLARLFRKLDNPGKVHEHLEAAAAYDDADAPEVREILDELGTER